jgi:ATP-dependent Clp protease, protease subunit
MNHPRLRASFAVFIAILLGSACVLSVAQSTAPAAQNNEWIISFLGPIDSGSMAALLRSVNDQIRQNHTNITILIASPGGDTTAAFFAYNVLKTLPATITTFNVGNVDSAAMLLYCAGTKRYSMPATRFLIHGNSYNPPPNTALDGASLDAQLQQVKSLNQMVIHVISETAQKKETEIEAAVHGQQILTPEQAKQWGIVQEIKENFMVPGATMVSVSAPSPEQKTPSPYSSVTNQ